MLQQGVSLREADEIRTPPIRTAISSTAALHELGHMLGRHQRSRRIIVRERWAWTWRGRIALRWTPRWSGALAGEEPAPLILIDGKRRRTWTSRRHDLCCRAVRTLGDRHARQQGRRLNDAGDDDWTACVPALPLERERCLRKSIKQVDRRVTAHYVSYANIGCDFA